MHCRKLVESCSRYKCICLEDYYHLFYDCEYSSSFWKKFSKICFKLDIIQAEMKVEFKDILVGKDGRSNYNLLSFYNQARSQGAVGAVAPLAPPPPPLTTRNAQKKRGKGRERQKKENKVGCMHVKLPPFNHFQKVRFVLYEENTGHMHQIAPLITSECKMLSVWEGKPTHPPPPPLSLRSLVRYF